MKKTFVKVSRSFYDSPYWKERRKFGKADALLDILQFTDYKDGKMETSYRQLAERWEWKPTSVHRFVRYLIDEGYLTVIPSRNGIVLKSFNGTPSGTPNGTPKSAATKGLEGVGGTPNGTPDGTPETNALYVHAGANKNDIFLNHSKEEIRKEKYKKNFGNYDFSFISDEMDEAYFEWLTYRKEAGKPFANNSTLKQNYDKLMSLSGGSPEMALAIVRQSIERQWQGLFALLRQPTQIPVGTILQKQNYQKKKL